MRGEFDNLAIPSLTDWINHNPAVKWGAIAIATLGVASILGMISSFEKS